MKKLTVQTILMYAVYTAFVLLSQTLVGGALAFGMFVGALYSANPLVAAVVYVASAVLGGGECVMHAAVRAAVMLAFVLIHKLAKRKIGKGMLLLYMVLANVFYVVFGFDGYAALAEKLMQVALATAFAYVSVYMLRAVFVRGINYKPAFDECVCIALFVVAASFCLAKYTLWGLCPTYFVAPFAVLFCACALDDRTTLVCGSLVGVGHLLATGTFECCVFCVIVAVCAVTLGKLNRYVAAVSVLCADIVLSYFFNLHGRFDTIVFVPTAVSVLVFVVIPGGVYRHIRDCAYGGAELYLSRSVTQKLGVAMSRRLYRLSDIFLTMRNAFYSVSQERVTAGQAQNAMVRQVSESVCIDCEQRNKCWRENIQDTEQSLLNMTVCAVKRGKCSILDVPQGLSVRCDRVSRVISEINGQAKSYAEYVSRVEQSDSSRTLVAEQMGGVSGLLMKLAADCKERAVSDSDRETELVERLVFHNVMCIGSTVIRQNGMLSAYVTVSAKDDCTDVIEQVASGVLGSPMIVERVEATDSAEWHNVILSAKPRFEVSYGIASAVKDGNDIGGDTHTVLRTDNGKCILALCDGMGSGQKAEEMSSTAIGLVESFYRAGFDNDVILTCVNKLLTGCGNEVFCAVDMVVLDLYNGLADFIKLGATSGIVRCGDKVEIVAGSSLPLGVLEEMRPSVTKKALGDGDVVVLVTDGVTDCFREANALATAFSQCTVTNPQSMAEDILSKAMAICKNHPADDMTVLVAKIN